jgi:hypothetical protein
MKVSHFVASIVVVSIVVGVSLFSLEFWPRGIVGCVVAVAGIASAWCTLWMGMREHPTTSVDRRS